jgi:transmembrane sensor
LTALDFHSRSSAGEVFTMGRENITQTAAEWFARRRSGHWSENQEKEFTIWLESNPDHRREFDRFETLWSDLDRARAVMAGDAIHCRTAESRSGRGKTARWVMALATIVLMAMGSPYYYRSVQPVFQKSLVTAPRQRLESTLTDGSKLALNVDSRVQVVFFRDRREVSLTRGEVFFEVARDTERPFLVHARDITIRVLGTAFNVYLASDDVRVSVHEGRVEISEGNKEAQKLVLEGGQAVKLSESTSRYAVKASDVGAWRSGQVVFRNQPLPEVLKEVGRYRSQPIVLANAELGERCLSGVLNLDNPENFLDALPHILPVKIQRKRDGTLVVLAKE